MPLFTESNEPEDAKAAFNTSLFGFPSNIPQSLSVTASSTMISPPWLFWLMHILAVSNARLLGDENTLSYFSSFNHEPANFAWCLPVSFKGTSVLDWTNPSTFQSVCPLPTDESTFKASVLCSCLQNYITTYWRIVVNSNTITVMSVVKERE